MMSKAAKEYYWAAVAGCLVWMHHVPKRKSLNMAAAYRARLEKIVGKSPASDIIYHEEPFDVACALAHNEVELDGANWDTYMQILDAKDPFEVACGLANAKNVPTTRRATAAKAAKSSALKSKPTSPRKKRKPA
jgi:hypothetical protein